MMRILSVLLMMVCVLSGGVASAQDSAAKMPGALTYGATIPLMRVSAVTNGEGADVPKFDVLSAGAGVAINWNTWREPGQVNLAVTGAFFAGFTADEENFDGNISIALMGSLLNNAVSLGIGYDLLRTSGDGTVGLISGIFSGGDAITSRAVFLLVNFGLNVGEEGGSGGGAIKGFNTITY